MKYCPMNKLEEIIAERGRDVAAAQARVPMDELLAQATGRTHHSLAERLRAGTGTNIIAEIKKASPSAGLLRPDYRPGTIAVGYEQAGAAGISVLTEPRHFLGGEDHLRDVRARVDVPVLRKDFTCDPYHVAEAAAWGADVVLLIVAALDKTLVAELFALACTLGLDVLVESHTAAEVEIALALEGAIIGVNSRDLKTLQTDLAIARGLAGMMPPDRLCIAESGIKTRDEIDELEQLGYKGFLVGETLMRGDDPAVELRTLLGMR